MMVTNGYSTSQLPRMDVLQSLCSACNNKATPTLQTYHHSHSNIIFSMYERVIGFFGRRHPSREQQLCSAASPPKNKKKHSHAALTSMTHVWLQCSHVIQTSNTSSFNKPVPICWDVPHHSIFILNNTQLVTQAYEQHSNCVD
jgi:hypothetical protein